ncbi:hypothetical protein FFLO_01885 [Filobasidium floriforme]|uniref:Cytochrome c oxidase assembly protein COX16, mitochondrial n=1 Tax=Filobasidium floriforme TaxID=5210 RepID=A0A8K0JNT6_9TREE|nr:cytochrome c oxidase assembly protein COX16-domain-containing protein [Filobasidium floriforme]KAG7562725.1 hypothetical protein FFLO_01885 [Filobasidium floriforme]KAH8086799.1 cytochrome c oxidase assembly protein COX16-domain-containing protein [Filobasidium floriforme]
MFPSQPLNPTPFQKTVASRLRNRPFLYFGVPFLSIVVLASYGLQGFTKTRYDYHDTKVQTITKEDELKMSKGRKKLDLREEYYRLQNLGIGSDEYDIVRVARPAGVPEWGVDATVKSTSSSAANSEPRARLV